MEYLKNPEKGIQFQQRIQPGIQAFIPIFEMT